MLYVDNYNCNCNFSSSKPYPYPKWSELVYYREETFPIGLDTSAGSWPLYFFTKNCVGDFFNLNSEFISFNLKKPNRIDYSVELNEVESVQNYLINDSSQPYIDIAKFWGTGVPVNQWTPIALNLISTYKVTPPKSARILSCLHCVINDAFNITWYYKYLYDCPRPCQLNHNLQTVLDTPRFPSYPSGHSVISGACEVLLSYYFPMESKKLHDLAEDASISRLYGGIHFRSDLEEGLKLGRQIGSEAVKSMKHDFDSNNNTVDHIYNNFQNAPILPPYYN